MHDGNWPGCSLLYDKFQVVMLATLASKATFVITVVKKMDLPFIKSIVLSLQNLMVPIDE
jgi:hypothetical protein